MKTSGGGTGGGNPGGGAQVITVEEVYWQNNDRLGTPPPMTDVNGIVVWKADYTPFGVAAVNEDPDGDGVQVVIVR